MTNVEALIKLAKALGVPMLEEEKRATYIFNLEPDFTDSFEISYSGQKYIKVSDSTPSYELLKEGTAYAVYSKDDNGTEWERTDYGTNGNGTVSPGTNATCGVLNGSDEPPDWLVIYNTSFNTGALGPGTIITAPSTGIYFRESDFTKYHMNLCWNETTDFFDHSVANVINYIAENLPSHLNTAETTE